MKKSRVVAEALEAQNEMEKKRVEMNSKSAEAQIQAAEGMVARDQAQLEGAMRDVRRYTELVEKNATPVTNLDNAKTQAAVWTAAKAADEGTLKQLQVQLSYTTIRAPISGRAKRSKSESNGETSLTSLPLRSESVTRRVISKPRHERCAQRHQSIQSAFAIKVGPS